VSDITVSLSPYSNAVTVVGQQGPAGPPVPAGTDTRVLFSDNNAVGTSALFVFNKTTGALTLTGAASVTSLSVAGTSVLTGAVTAGSLGVNTTLAVSGASTLASLGVTGATTVGTTLAVTGLTTLANTLEVRNGAVALGSFVYNSFTDTSNYERACLGWDRTPNVFELVIESAGTGNTSRSINVGTRGSGNLNLVTGNVLRWRVTGSGNIESVGDNNYDIGAAGANRPRDLHLARNLEITGKIALGTGGYIRNSATFTATLFNSSNDLTTLLGIQDDGVIKVYSGGLQWVNDNTYDIGAVANNRPRRIYAATGVTTGLFEATATFSATTPQIDLNGATGNWIGWNTAGIAAPTFTTRSAGTKLVLWPALSASALDWAAGIDSATMWFSNGVTDGSFKWYVNSTTPSATLSGTTNAVLTMRGGYFAWNSATPGLSKGSIHLGDGGSATGISGAAITFGSRDSGSGATAQAGIYTVSDATFGTKMYLATTSSYVTGSMSALEIDNFGNVTLLRGNALRALNPGVINDATNFERGGIRWGANFLEFYTEIGGTGTRRGAIIDAANLTVKCNGTSRWGFTTTGHIVGIQPNANDIGDGSQNPRNIFADTAFIGPAHKFPATQIASADPNTLDDYEESDTYTPTLSFGTGTVGITYGTRLGSYTKIGRMVYFKIEIALTSKGTSTGVAAISLPIGSLNVGRHVPAYTANTSGFTTTVFAQFPDINFGPSHISLVTNGSFLQDTNFTNTTVIGISGCYEAS
jgi:hypothetical protein